ncbi:DNA-formamidopyrimidine glycosylase [Thermoactinomyces intermedius]|uniref:Formamidopyrimidine-DNA glycosylase n=1 Tax=Thermoactinomyces intermedius TaxID=2024 RepID=A0A8I1DEB7_THEIN|nr:MULTISPECIES: DNA-formamidopyrimidine glycosylase [Thermoactinomyces]MBA4548899.1 DNA-formamidopyrimidine glycosylase [Thermoactinomyces intermedius]MBA4836848.1 DNA-formamidopyrimidine glycosylase [Thermoactinomyces intermedius]MBH8594777.1 DNA-formamidopyrimidine glycosylase [Thermoactinomyces intermedius]MBH8601964.1 DNA-formamidopyrimidine glycosylase [Thermoactinomyces sp. CICC 23799]
MPELPEVETVRKTLQKLVVGKEIEDVTIRLPRIIKRPDDTEAFRSMLAGTTISGIGRRGKFLKIVCDPLVLVSHLRMEGKYRLAEQGEPCEKHTHVIFHFTDGTELRYRDVRQFGTMHLFAYGEEDEQLPLKKLGPEPLTDAFQLPWFQALLAKRKSNIKAVLLNQEYIAGLGNIYVDESLFRAGIHPTRTASSLKEEEVERLYHSIQQTLKEAIELGGSSVRSYLNGEGEMGMFQMKIQVYGRKHEPCLKCGRPIERLVVAGRGTHVCSHCQR